MLHYVFSEEMEGVLIVPATGNFPAQQTLRVRETELKIDGTESQCSRMGWVGSTAGVGPGNFSAKSEDPTGSS